MDSEVKWIKIATGIFDDDAFQMIDDLPERDAIELIWFKLLVFCGKKNNHGLFIFKDTVAYTDEMLASIFHRPINTVRLAMKTFVDLHMIDVIDDVYAIPNWDKYQSLDSLERKKERDREYQRKCRENQRLAIENKKSSDNRLTSDDSSYSYSISNSISTSNSLSNKDKENKDIKDIDINNNNNDNEESSVDTPRKHKYGEFQKVRLTDKEYEKLAKEFGEETRDEAIKFLDEYIAEKGYKSKSHNLAIRRWVIDAVKERKQKEMRQKPIGNAVIEAVKNRVSIVDDWV